MSTIELRQQSIQGDVSEETKTVKIPGRIGGYLHHASNAMIFVLDSPEVLMRTALRYEHDRPATTIDSRRCE